VSAFKFTNKLKQDKLYPFMTSSTRWIHQLWVIASRHSSRVKRSSKCHNNSSSIVPVKNTKEKYREDVLPNLAEKCASSRCKMHHQHSEKRPVRELKSLRINEGLLVQTLHKACALMWLLNMMYSKNMPHLTFQCIVEECSTDRNRQIAISICFVTNYWNFKIWILSVSEMVRDFV